jgi:predicted PolB exonuclease-like 3'-5' exonuclease
MNTSVIVWDIETVPDIAGFAAANDLVGKSEVEVREAIGDKFPKHIYHSIVCIGALIAHREADYWAVDAVGAPHGGERTEKQLITAFCDKIAELHQIGAKPLIGFDIIADRDSKSVASARSGLCGVVALRGCLAESRVLVQGVGCKQ